MALSNLPAIHAGIAAQMQTATSIGNVLTKLPAAPSNEPLMYIVRPRFRRLEATYGEQSLEWTFDAVVALPRNNNLQVEDDLEQVIIDVINVSGHDLHGHESITDGQILINSGRTDYGRINGIDVLAFEFTITVVERVPYEFALGE